MLTGECRGRGFEKVMLLWKNEPEKFNSKCYFEIFSKKLAYSVREAQVVVATGSAVRQGSRVHRRGMWSPTMPRMSGT